MPVTPISAAPSLQRAGLVSQDVYEAPAPPTPRFESPRFKNNPRQSANLLASQQSRPALATRSLRADLLGNDAEQAEMLALAAAHVENGGSLAELRDNGRWSAAALYELAVLLGQRQESGSTGAERYRLEAESLLARYGAEIHATLNTSAALMTAASSRADRNWLRGLYMEVTRGQVSVVELFESLLARFGPRRFRQGAMGMIAALNEDLNARTASSRADSLQMMVLASLVATRRLLSLTQSLRDLLARLGMEGSSDLESEDAQNEKEHAPSENGGDHATDAITAVLLRQLLQAMAPKAGVSALRTLVEDELCAGLDHNQQAQVQGEFVRFIQQIPNPMWREVAQKDKLVDGLRRAWWSHASSTSPKATS
jgi:hypothetical protein